MKKILFVLVTLAVALALPGSVLADPTIEGPTYLVDPFNTVSYKQPFVADPSAPFWLINNGDFTEFGPQYYQECGDASCISAVSQGYLKFVRLKLLPDATPGNYTGTEVSENQTGFSYGQGFERWLPTPGHPVVTSSVIRLSDGFNQDGTGGAVGSFGIWQWNSYIDFLDPENPFKPVQSFGFDWIEQGAVIGSGLYMTVFQDGFPVYRQLVTKTVNLQQWNVLTTVWAINGSGNQVIYFFINGHLTGQTTLTTPLPALSTTVWHDNQYPAGFNPEDVEFHNPPVDQWLDLDVMSVVQPDN